MPNFRKPPELKVLHGTDQPCREAPEVSGDSGSLPKSIPIPETLGTPGRRKWRELVKLLRDRGLLDRVDLGALEMCCLAYDEVVSCQKAINAAGGIVGYCQKPKTDKDGKIVFGLDGKIQYVGRSSQEVPLLTTKTKAMETYKKYMIEFGLSPASRSRLGIKPGKEESEFERYLREMKENNANRKLS